MLGVRLLERFGVTKRLLLGLTDALRGSGLIIRFSGRFPPLGLGGQRKVSVLFNKGSWGETLAGKQRERCPWLDVCLHPSASAEKGARSRGCLA